MSGVIRASWAQLLPLACIIVMAASQGCDDVTCCSGKVCMEESTGKSGMNKTRCVTPTSCDQLVCPDGLSCVEVTRGSKTVMTRAICQASCDLVDCPDFLQCMEKGSMAACVAPSDCSLVSCSPGTICQLLSQGTQQKAVCLGDSCDSVDCFPGSECFNATSTTKGTKMQISVQIDTDSTPVPLKSLIKPSRRRKRKSSKTKKTKKTKKNKKTKDGMNSSDGAMGQQDGELAVCLPMCEGADVCPQGLVCEEQGYGLICREPRSCDELECPAGQECQEVMCGTTKKGTGMKTKDGTGMKTKDGTGMKTKDGTGMKTKDGTGMKTKDGTGTKTNDGTGTMASTKTRSNILVSCVDIAASGGSGGSGGGGGGGGGGSPNDVPA